MSDEDDAVVQYLKRMDEINAEADRQHRKVDQQHRIAMGAILIVFVLAVVFTLLKGFG
jgi:hypothetical protein